MHTHSADCVMANPDVQGRYHTISQQGDRGSRYTCPRCKVGVDAEEALREHMMLPRQQMCEASFGYNEHGILPDESHETAQLATATSSEVLDPGIPFLTAFSATLPSLTISQTCGRLSSSSRSKSCLTMHKNCSRLAYERSSGCYSRVPSTTTTTSAFSPDSSSLSSRRTEST